MAIPSFTKHSFYRVYTGSAWETISFKTDIADIGESSTKRVLKPETHTVNGQSFYSNGNDQGITLNGSHIKFTGTTTSLGNSTSLTANTTLNVALMALADAIVAARNAIPAGVLTTDNYTTGLDNRYLKITDISSWAKASSKPSYTASEVGAVPTTRKVNNKALSADINLYATDIKMSNDEFAYTIPEALAITRQIAEGKSKAYVTTLNSSNIYYGSSAIDSEQTSLPSGTTAIAISDSTSSLTVNGNYLILKNPSTLKYYSVAISDLKIGDVLYITDTNVPDFWYSSDHAFSKLETTKVDLTGYATQTWVTNKGYLTSSALTGYATETWVNNKGYTTNTGTVTSITIKTGTGLTGGSNTAATTTGTWTIGIDSGYKLPTTEEWAAKISLISYYLNGSAIDEFDGKSIGLTAAGGTNITTGTAAVGYTIKTPTYIIGTSAMSSPIKGDIWFDTSTS